MLHFGCVKVKTVISVQVWESFLHLSLLYFTVRFLHPNPGFAIFSSSRCLFRLLRAERHDGRDFHSQAAGLRGQRQLRSESRGRLHESGVVEPPRSLQEWVCLRSLGLFKITGIYLWQRIASPQISQILLSLIIHTQTHFGLKSNCALLTLQERFTHTRLPQAAAFCPAHTYSISLSHSHLYLA